MLAPLRLADQQLAAGKMLLRRSSCAPATRQLAEAPSLQNLRRRSSWAAEQADESSASGEQDLRQLLLASVLSTERRRRALLVSDKYLIKNDAELCVLDDIDEESPDDAEKMDLSFSGAGFMGCYYFGVVNCWNKYIPRERVRRVAGASAGSLIAAYYLLDMPLDICLYEIVTLLDGIRKRPLGVFDRKHQIVDLLPAVLDKVFPEDAHERVNGRLFVSMTRLRDMKNVVVNQFNSKQELIDALNCSSFIPVWSGNHVSTFRGVRHIDGGFTNNLPVFDEHTIRICCFSGTSDIAPTDRTRLELLRGNIQGMPFYLNWANLRRAGRALWPPPATYIIGLMERGFHDTKDFILTNDLIQCDKCYQLTAPDEQPIYCKLTPTISPALSRAGSFAGLAKLADGAGDGEPAERNATPPAKSAAHRLRLKLPGAGGKRMASPTSDSCDSFADGEESRNRSASSQSSNRQELQAATDSPLSAPSSQTGLDLATSESSSSFKSMLGDRLRRLASLQQSAGGGRARVRESPMAAPTIVIEPPPTEQSADSGVDEAPEAGEQRARHPVRSKLILVARKERAASSSASSSTSSDAEDQADGAREDAADRGRESSAPTRKQQRVFAKSKSKKAKAETAEWPQQPIKLGKLSHRRQSLASVATNSPSEKFIASSRRNTEAHIDPAQIFLLTDKFSRVAEPLPSCPPSPNLNRHCSECIRLRQEARLDAVDEDIMRQAEKYASPRARELEMLRAGARRNKLTSPIRWFRQRIGTKSYAFGREPGASRASAQTVAY